MKLNPAQLGKHLQAGLAPVYVVSGDEPLLCQEAEDAIRAATRQQGFSERTVFHAEASFDWGLLYQAGASLSLFAEKKLIELRIDAGELASAAQSLTVVEQLQARRNIGAVAASDVGNTDTDFVAVFVGALV